MQFFDGFARDINSACRHCQPIIFKPSLAEKFVSLPGSLVGTANSGAVTT